MTFKEAVEKWIEFECFEDGYAYKIRGILNRELGPVVSSMPLYEITEEHIGRAVKNMEEKSFCPRTIAANKLIIQRFYFFICEREKLNSKEEDELDVPKTIYTDEEENRIREAISRLPLKDLYQFCLDTGINPAKAILIRQENIDINNGTILMTEQISGNPRKRKFLSNPVTYEMDEKTKTLVVSLLDENEYLFPEKGDEALRLGRIIDNNIMLKMLTGIQNVSLNNLSEHTLSKQNQPVIIPSKYMTFKELSVLYFSYVDEKRSVLKGNSWGPVTISDDRGRRGAVRRHAFPSIGNIELKDFDTMTCKILVSDLKRKGMTQSYIHTIVVWVRNIVKHGQKLGYVDKEVVNSFYVKNDTSPKCHLYSDEELSAICNVSLSIPNAIMYPMVLFTGMSSGEIRALYWSDINIQDKTLYLRRCIGKERESIDIKIKPLAEEKCRKIYLKGKAWQFISHQYSLEFPGKTLDESAVLPDFLIFHKKNDRRKFLSNDMANIIRKMEKASGVNEIGFKRLRKQFEVIAMKTSNDPLATRAYTGKQSVKAMLNLESYVTALND